MAEVGANPESAREYEPVKLRDISIGEHVVRLGHLYKKPGTSYELRNTYSRDADILGGDKLTEVYFRTASGNIYMLDDQGNLINGNETAKHGVASGVKLDSEELEKMKLVVGEPFRFKGGNTTELTEIVPMTERMYPANRLVGQKSSTILEEFQRKVPPKELGDWGRDPITHKKLLRTRLPDKLQDLRKPQART